MYCPQWQAGQLESCSQRRAGSLAAAFGSPARSVSRARKPAESPELAISPSDCAAAMASSSAACCSRSWESCASTSFFLILRAGTLAGISASRRTFM